MIEWKDLKENDLIPGTDYKFIKIENKKVTYICPIHGVRVQRKCNVLKRGCSLCSKKRQIKNQQKHFKDVIDLLKITYPHIDFSNSVYIGSQNQMTACCSIHGAFTRRASNLIKTGCPKCSLSLGQLSTKESLLNNLKELHPNIKYSIEEYQGYLSKIKVDCPTHGISYSSYNVLVKSPTGCRKCSTLHYNPCVGLIKNLLNLYTDDVIENFRPDWMEGKELDLYSSNLNLAIEYNGTSFHHSSKDTNNSSMLSQSYKKPDYHLDKFLRCRINNINLIHIFNFEDLDEWLDTLNSFLIEKNTYRVSYRNIKRRVYFSGRYFNVYGKSYILPLGG